MNAKHRTGIGAGALALFFCWQLVFASAGGANADELPWALRDHYAFRIGAATFHYAVDSGRWDIVAGDYGPIIRNAGFHATLEDGTVVSGAPGIDGLSRRERFSNALGDGASFDVELPASGGLRLRHRVATYKRWPFMTIHVALGNEGSAPVSVRSISPVVLEQGAPGGARPGLTSSLRKVARRGPFLVYDKAGGATAVFIADMANGVAVALGMIPQSVARSRLDIRPSGSGSAGEAVCVFDPPARLAPGEWLEADPVFVSFGLPEPERVDSLYASAYHALTGPGIGVRKLDAWVAVSEETSPERVYELVKPWRGGPVRHVLLPEAWEEHAGREEVVKELKRMGMTPGLIIDPLGALKRRARAAVDSDDGRRWLDLANPKARGECEARMRGLEKAGFGFVVLRSSAAPDSVLRRLGMTRDEADRIALETIAETGRGLAVVPSAVSALDENVDAWLEAAASLGSLQAHALPCGPVRFDVSKTPPFTESLKAALVLYGGPIEFTGNPDRKTLRDLAKLFPRLRIAGFPVDAACRAPKLWLAAPGGAADGPDAAADMALVFSGPPQVGHAGLRARLALCKSVWYAQEDRRAAGFLETLEAAAK